MKHAMGIIVAALLLEACGSGQRGGDQLTWHQDSIPTAYVDELLRSAGDTALSGEVKMSYPTFEGGAVADSINKRVEAAIAAAIGIERWPQASLAAAVDTMARETVEMLSGFTVDGRPASIGFYIHTGGEVTRYEGAISVQLSVSTYLGGAHGMSQMIFLNFDAADGRELRQEEMFTDHARLIELNRAAFQREVENRVEDVMDACLFYPFDSIPLPENLMVDSAGVRMHYNPYEVSCYAFGATDYTLPMSEVESMLGKIYGK